MYIIVIFVETVPLKVRSKLLKMGNVSGSAAGSRFFVTLHVLA